MLNPNKTFNFINAHWDGYVIPGLIQYVSIPCKSPMFDPHWQQHGYIDQAMELLFNWCQQQNIEGLQLTIQRLPGKSPLLMMEIPGQSDETVLLYGHMDKQPEMSGWDDGLGPWTPIIKNKRLYGRGGADDGYATFAAICAIKALQEQKIPHARCVVLIEASEESGSPDLPAYIEHLKDQIGTPSLVICLDSGCGNYDQLWCTTSLRGSIAGVLTVEILKEGVHSGAASGVVPCSVRILRQLLSRIEDEKTGEILLKELQVEIPKTRIAEAKQTADALGDRVWTDYPFVESAKPVSGKGHELVLNRTWRPALAITGAGDLPSLENAGNVLRPKTSVMLSMRIPPYCNPERAAQALKKTLEANPPYDAKVSFKLGKASVGWDAPIPEEWLTKAINKASENYFGKSAMYMGEGGSIPFMGMLGEKFPKAQFMITGVLGPQSNAHGPNEFLDLPTAKKLSCCVTNVLSEHYARKNS